MSNNRSIDKEAMYKKLMPSASNKEKLNELSDAKTEDHTVASSDETLNQPRSYFKPKVLVNLAEAAVRIRREEAMKRFKCCSCDRCIKDVTALAVNQLPPKYVVVFEEDIQKEVKKYEGDIVSALVNAIVIVKNQPRH